MTPRFRAHFDGRALIPDEPVDLPLNQPLELTIAPAPTNGQADARTISERLERLSRASGIIAAPAPPPEAFDRESMYDERL